MPDPVFLDSDAWWTWADRHQPPRPTDPDPWRGTDEQPDEQPTVVDLTDATANPRTEESAP